MPGRKIISIMVLLLGAASFALPETGSGLIDVTAKIAEGAPLAGATVIVTGPIPQPPIRAGSPLAPIAKAITDDMGRALIRNRLASCRPPWSCSHRKQTGGRI